MNPYDRMVMDLIMEAEEGVLDESDEEAISIFSEGESERYDDIDDDIEDIEDDDDDEDEDEDY